MYSYCKHYAANILVVVSLIVSMLDIGMSFAQTTTTNTMRGVTCNASGSSNAVFPANGSRTGFVIINDSAVAVRIASIVTGVALTDLNSIIIGINGTYSTGQPSVYQGPIWCMSTAGAATIHVTEATFP